MKGIGNILKYHEENKASSATNFKIQKDGEFAMVRILQEPEEWDGVFLHSEYKKTMPTRCKSTFDANGVEDRSTCPLCMQQIDRSMKTILIVGRRGESIDKAVQVIEYGRDSLQEVIAQIQNLPQGVTATMVDFKVQRFGTGTDTKYKWFMQHNTVRPLSDGERGLPVPTLDELYPIMDDFKMLDRAKKSIQATQVAAVQAEAPTTASQANPASVF